MRVRALVDPLYLGNSDKGPTQRGGCLLRAMHKGESGAIAYEHTSHSSNILKKSLK